MYVDSELQFRMVQLVLNSDFQFVSEFIIIKIELNNINDY